jgi:hypothetical protein
MLDRWCADTRCRFSTPTAEWSWMNGRQKVHFKKIDPLRWEIDTRELQHPVRIEASVPGFKLLSR